MSDLIVSFQFSYKKAMLCFPNQERRGELARQKKENRLSGGGCGETPVEETASSG